MFYLIAAYWPFVLAALLIGAAVGWLNRDPGSVDDMTAWLEREPDEL